MITNIEKLPKKTYKLKITVEKDVVDKAFEHALEHFAKQMQVEGFRQGKAPMSIVKEKVDNGKLNGEVVNSLIPSHYSAALKEHKINPITSPKVEINQFEKGKEFIFTATAVEKPDINLGDYKKSLKSLETKDKKPTVEDIVNKILETVQIEVPQLLIDEEITNMFSSLIDQTARLGITIEDYLKSHNKTVETLRAEYSRIAEYNLKADLLLNEIANVEKIQVTDEEIQKTIQAAPDEETRKALSNENQKWYIKSILRKNKVIQNLINYE